MPSPLLARCFTAFRTPAGVDATIGHDYETHRAGLHTLFYYLGVSTVPAAA